MAPQNRGRQNSKKIPPNVIKANFQTPKRILVYCFVTIKVQR
jgi:hypothetical protein